MKKLALTALVAAITFGSLASTASADNNNDDDQWRRHGQRDNNGWDGQRDDGDRQARRNHNDDNDEWRWRNRRDHWRHHRPHWSHRYDRDICWVKKVRRYDDWGNVYIKRIRVCQ
jgi:Ni/Co efflux regulator RcnB